MPLIVWLIFCISIVVIFCDCMRVKPASKKRKIQTITDDSANDQLVFEGQLKKMFQEYLEAMLVDETVDVQTTMPVSTLQFWTWANHSYKVLRVKMRKQKWLKSNLKALKRIELHNRGPPLNFCY